MEIQLYELSKLSPQDARQTPVTTRAYMARYREAIVQRLEAEGFDEIRITRYVESAPERPEMLAMKGEREVCICFAQMPESPFDIGALSEGQVRYCDERHGECDVYYACLTVSLNADRLNMLGPAPVKLDGVWQLQEPELRQFLPLSMCSELDRLSAFFGEAALFRLDRMFIPYVLKNCKQPRFSIGGLFDDQPQGENGLAAVMPSDPPTHFALVSQRADGSTKFLRTFFYADSRPVSELELMRCLDEGCGLAELIDRTGRVLYAECLEAALYPHLMAYGKHYMWTLSLGATSFRRAHASSREDVSLYQEPRDSFSILCAPISQIDETLVDGQRAWVWTLHPQAHNPELEVRVFVGEPVVTAAGCGRPSVGEVVEVQGFLYACPDELVETNESWQDSGEVAAMQETQRLENEGKQARRGHAPYSLAHAVVASAFAAAGYSDLGLHSSHTRQNPTFIVRRDDGYTALLFLDVEIGDEPSRFPYSAKQMESILARERARLGTGLGYHHCVVRLTRRSECAFGVSLRVEPECSGVPTLVETEETIEPVEDESLDEAQACRLIANAVCHQSWGSFAAVAHEDLSYTSLVNGAKTLGKVEYIRYMAERKPLWESQQAWQGICIETGSIEYVGVRRPCFMLSCYGRMVGAAVVTLHAGRVADIVTLPLEANETFEPDAECTQQPRIFHPMKGRLTTYAMAPTPLQRFSLAYLQDCMIRKTGFCGATGSQESTYISDGVERKLDVKGARWVKTLRHDPSFCDLAFTCAGRLYAVCAVEAPKHPENGGDIREIVESLVPQREALLRMAEQHRLIPCVFPVQREHAPSPSKTWNLWDLRTLEPVTPTMESGDEDAPMSEWEVLHAGLAEAAHMLSVGGCEIIASHDMPGLLPHLWFRDPHGQISWMVVRPHTCVAYPDRAASEAELLAVRLTQGVPGYVVDAEPYQDANFTQPAATRDALKFVKVTMPLPLN